MLGYLGGQLENLGCILPRFQFSFLNNVNSPKLGLVHHLGCRGSFGCHFHLPAQFLFTGTLFVSLYCQRIGIVQCFVFLGFLSLLENFRLETPIAVGIRVLGVETPL